jgi:hypothetical protein
MTLVILAGLTVVPPTLRAFARPAATVSVSVNHSSRRQLKSRPSADSGKPSDSIAPFTARRIAFRFLNNFRNI